MRFFLLALTLILSLPAFAETTPPIPARKKDALTALEREIEVEKSRQKELDSKASTIQSDLSSLKKDLVKTASQVQKHEKDLRTTEQKIAELSTQKSKLDEDLGKDRAQMAELITALGRIQRVPPQALIARPGAPEETAQAATLLSAILPVLNKRAEDLRQKLEALEEVERNLTDNRDKLAKTSEKLKTAQNNVESLMGARVKAYQQTKKELEDQAKVVQSISKEAADFRDLIDKIEAKNKTLRDMAGKATGAAPSKAPARKAKADLAMATADLPSLGSSQLPLSGIVRVRYGEVDEIGAASEGIKIEGRTGALIVAPMGGIVRYAGEFKKYGNIVLIEHKKNYHSLIAGLGRIDTFVGQSVDSGEPIGILGNSSGGRPVMYYELRYKGQPINPAKKFGDLEG